MCTCSNMKNLCTCSNMENMCTCSNMEKLMQNFKRIRMTNPCNFSKGLLKKILDFSSQFNDVLLRQKLNHGMGLNVTASTVCETVILY